MNNSELLGTQTQSGKNPINSTSESEHLQTRERIKGTPFWLVGNKENGYQIIMGKYSLLDFAAATPEDALQELKTDKWNIVSKMMIITYNTMEDFKQEDLKLNPIIQHTKLNGL